MNNFPIKTLNIFIPFSKHVKTVFTCEMKIKMLLSTEADSPGILSPKSTGYD